MVQRTMKLTLYWAINSMKKALTIHLVHEKAWTTRVMHGKQASNSSESNYFITGGLMANFLGKDIGGKRRKADPLELVLMGTRTHFGAHRFSNQQLEPSCSSPY